MNYQPLRWQITRDVTKIFPFLVKFLECSRSRVTSVLFQDLTRAGAIIPHRPNVSWGLFPCCQFSYIIGGLQHSKNLGHRKGLGSRYLISWCNFCLSLLLVIIKLFLGIVFFLSGSANTFTNSGSSIFSIQKKSCIDTIIRCSSFTGYLMYYFLVYSLTVWSHKLN